MKTTPVQVRLTPAQREAVAEATKRRRQRTGEACSLAALAREGLADAVRAEGVAWPEEGER